MLSFDPFDSMKTKWKKKNIFIIQLLLINISNVEPQISNSQNADIQNHQKSPLCIVYDRIQARHFTGRLFYGFYHNHIRLDHFIIYTAFIILKGWIAENGCRLPIRVDLNLFIFHIFFIALQFAVGCFIYFSTHLDSLVTPRNKRDYLLSFTGCA